jgi:hypothetical protein
MENKAGPATQGRRAVRRIGNVGRSVIVSDLEVRALLLDEGTNPFA